MDEQLKQRLLGATIIVACVVIFVPMLFEDADHPRGKAVAEAPALPDTIEEKTIELPKSASDIAQAEKSDRKEEKTEAESGYRVIPLEDAPPKPAKAAPPPAPTEEAAASPEEPVEEAVEAPAEEEFAGEGEGEEAPAGRPAAKTVPAIPKAALTESPKPPKSANTTALKPSVPAKKPKPGEPDVPAEAAGFPAPKSKPVVAPVAKPPGPVAKKPEKAKPPQLKPAEPVTSKPAKTMAPAENVADATEAPPPPVAAPKAPAPETLAKLSPAKPVEPKRPGREAEPPSAWVVQAGSFSGEGNARGLADRLRKQNIAAYVETINGSSGVTYRVRVGPELNRGRAEQIQKQIESAVGIKSLILPRK